MNRGDSHYKLKNIVEALKDYLQAHEIAGKQLMEITTRVSIVFHDLGAIYFNKKNYQEALEHFNNSIEFNKNSAELYVNRGKCMLEIGDSFRAKQDFQKAKELDPTNLDINSFLS